MEHNEYLAIQRRLSEFYFREMEPNLKKYRNLKRDKIIVIISMFIMVISLFFCLFLSLIKSTYVFIPVIAIVIVVFAIGICSKNTSSRPDLNLESDIKAEIMPKFLQIFNFENLKYSYGSLALPYKDLQWIKSLNVLKIFGTLCFDDRIEGEYNDLRFSIKEVNTSLVNVSSCLAALFLGLAFIGIIPFVLILLCIFLSILSAILGKSVSYSYGGNNLFSFLTSIAWVVVQVHVFCYIIGHKFRGILVEYDMNKDFEGHTFILDRTFKSNDIKIDTSKYEEVVLEDAEFMSMYKIYSTNQIEARYVLTTAFIERFKNLKTTFKSKYTRLAFKDNKIVVAIHTGRNMFKFADVISDVGRQTFIDLFNEIYSVLDIAEQLKLDQKLGL